MTGAKEQDNAQVGRAVVRTASTWSSNPSFRVSTLLRSVVLKFAESTGTNLVDNMLKLLQGALYLLPSLLIDHKSKDRV